MRGLIAWLGLKEITVPFERAPRGAGETKYPLSKMLSFAWRQSLRSLQCRCV
jgi:dolichol-phosphate mannosyltransferase